MVPSRKCGARGHSLPLQGLSQTPESCSAPVAARLPSPPFSQRELRKPHYLAPFVYHTKGGVGCAPARPTASLRSTHRIRERKEIARGDERRPTTPRLAKGGRNAARRPKRPPAPLLSAHSHRANSSQKPSPHPPQPPCSARVPALGGGERETPRPMSEALQVALDCFWKSERQEGVRHKAGSTTTASFLRQQRGTRRAEGRKEGARKRKNWGRKVEEGGTRTRRSARISSASSWLLPRPARSYAETAREGKERTRHAQGGSRYHRDCLQSHQPPPPRDGGTIQEWTETPHIVREYRLPSRGGGEAEGTISRAVTTGYVQGNRGNKAFPHPLILITDTSSPN